MVLDSTGDHVADIQSPANLMGIWVDRGHILGATYDEDWMPTLKVFELIE